MKFICKYICGEEKEAIAIEAISNKQVERYVYDFIFEQLSDKSDIQCSIVAFDYKNKEHLNVLKGQGGIFWEV
jgi:hypothetical protein